MAHTTQLQRLHQNDSPNTGSHSEALHAEIALAAYYSFAKSGRLHDSDVKDWLAAEAHVKAKHANEKHAHHEHHHAGSASGR